MKSQITNGGGSVGLAQRGGGGRGEGGEEVGGTGDGEQEEEEREEITEAKQNEGGPITFANIGLQAPPPPSAPLSPCPPQPPHPPPSGEVSRLIT